MPRPSNTAQRRLEITQALLRVMSRSGYGNASIQAIAKEAGLKSGLIHYHFKTKQDILVELITWLADKAQQRYIILLKDADSIKGQLEAFIDSALSLGEGADEDAVAAWVVIGAEAIRQPEVQVSYQQVVSRNKNELNKLLHHYVEEKALPLPPSTIEYITAMILSSIVGTYQLAVAIKTDMPRDYAAITLKSMVFALLHKTLTH
jgi:TetR/AcrR family transcriptional repressor of bet genes